MYRVPVNVEGKTYYISLNEDEGNYHIIVFSPQGVKLGDMYYDSGSFTLEQIVQFVIDGYSLMYGVSL